MNVKNCRTHKKDYNWNPSTYICENSKYLKNTSQTECDEIIPVMGIVSTKKTIITSNALINYNSTKERDI